MTSKIDKISYEGDSRVERRNTILNGRKYTYLYGEPASGKWKATILFLHGYPDLAVGWRYQIPYALQLGFRIVAPDQLGYGQTDAPEDYKEYAFKKIAADFKQLATQLGESQIVLCGHDWGAALAYAIYIHQRALISHIITVCVPYAPPRAKFTSLDDIVANLAPHWGYQLQFRSGEVEKVVRTKKDIQQFLLTMYGGKTSNGEWGFDPRKGIALDKLGQFQQSRILNGEDLEFYSSEYARHGVHGPLNWYRLTEVNHNDEKQYASQPNIEVPLLFIQALKDLALPPSMGKSMKKYIPKLTLEQVNTSHWALTEDPEGVNRIIGSWLGKFFPSSGNSKL
ncbi:putative epoxide hydrolase [Talaromyces proteolyticus]|uniref:Epoxide hydrolase n=1 Tax=Talaromyces proteolyticus TaxID=1131652 RepID=A0AAD4L566_9EURO|nr:putative epoxide hydrolase [Talaromyces proteolyticus]KAH8705271.1 putative epoxide hydrolase [Talaromyces proteolyticus]